MKLSKNRLVQYIFLLFAAGCLLIAGSVASMLDKTIEVNNLNPPQEQVSQNYPELTLLSIAPGGLRVWAINALWIRATKAKDAGRYYDAYQLANIICMLQPRSPGVWQFHAWNMAWNISAALHTPAQRWLWISNACRLLRDRGIPLNPESLGLYKELSWLFNNKIGANLDDMHLSYKQKWAATMHAVVGSIPVGSTEDVIAAFKIIADAPLDTSPARRRGDDIIQKDVLDKKILDIDPEAKAYTKKLAEVGVKIDKSLLEAYQKYSTDEIVMLSIDPVTRIKPANDDEQKLATLINDAHYTTARNTLIAFVRAQILWNVYRMDPDFMLELMTEYNMPLDWRLPWPHGIYWSTLGYKRTAKFRKSGVNTLNAIRNIIGPMKDLTSMGRLIYVENANDLGNPYINMLADTRFIEPTHQAHLKFINEDLKIKRKKKPDFKFKDHPLGGGHANYLRSCSMLLFRSYKPKEATKYWTFIRDKYEYTGKEWQFDTPQKAIAWHYSSNRKNNPYAKPRPAVARNQVTAALQTAWYLLANGDVQGYRRHRTGYALMLYHSYQSDIPERNELGPIAMFEIDTLSRMVTNPRNCGYQITFNQSKRLWAFARNEKLNMGMGHRFSQAALIYDMVMPTLTRQCHARDKKFDDEFPAPKDIDACRQWRKELLQKANIPNQ